MAFDKRKEIISESIFAVIAVLISLAGANHSFGDTDEEIIPLSKILHYAKSSGTIRQASNAIRSQKEKIKMLRSESSAIFQGRVKAGYYTRFAYDGYPRNYVAKPTIGFKYYMFGGNKYMRHVIDQAQPKYYMTISRYDSELFNKKKKVTALYLKYWYQKKKESLFHKLINSNALLKRLANKLNTVVSRMRLESYLAKMRAKIYITRINVAIDRKLPDFKAILPKSALAEANSSSLNKSVLSEHPGIAGLIRYYHAQKKIGWLKFVDVKFKGFLRPSYYPSAGKTKWSVIGGAYINIPFNIFGAIKHEDSRLALDKENIIIKLNDDNIKQRMLTQERKIKLPIYEKEIKYWKARSLLDKKNIANVSDRTTYTLSRKVKLIEHYCQEYRISIHRFLEAERKMYLIVLGF